MSLYRWSIGLLRLGVLLLAMGLIPELLAMLVGVQLAITVMLVLTVAPLGAAITLAALAMLAVALIRKHMGG